jgi:hypothetical protein
MHDQRRMRLEKDLAGVAQLMVRPLHSSQSSHHMLEVKSVVLEPAVPDFAPNLTPRQQSNFQDDFTRFHLIEEYLRSSQARTLVDQLGNMPLATRVEAEASHKKKAMHLGYCLFHNIKKNSPG